MSADEPLAHPHAPWSACRLCRGPDGQDGPTWRHRQSSDSVSWGDASPYAPHAGDTAHRLQSHERTRLAGHENGGKVRVDDDSVLHHHHDAGGDGGAGVGVRH